MEGALMIKSIIHLTIGTLASLLRRLAMDMQSFIYDGVEYQVEKVVKIDEAGESDRFQLHTTDGKIFILKYNQIVHQWVCFFLLGEGQQLAE